MIAKAMLGRLSDPSLVREHGYIGGEWLAAPDGARFPVLNPSTGAVLAEVANMGLPAIRQSIAAAEAAQPSWAAATGKERAAVLRRWHDLVLAHQDDLAAILTSEMGKPLAEARGEIAYAAAYIEWFAEEAKRVYGDVIPGHQRDKRLLVLKQPIGVVAAITPWNFPSAMVTRKLAPALAVGCAVVLKPAEETPLSALALAVLAERAGLPKGLLSIVPTSAPSVFGDEICANPAIRKLTFTGSTDVGRILMAKGAKNILRLSLELGGNAPFIVFDDADLEAAVQGAIAAKFRNNGQTCICANRIYAQSGIYDRFVERLAEAVGHLKVGDGFEPDTDLGPLINPAAKGKFQEHLSDAVTAGARVVGEYHPPPSAGTFVHPVIVADVTATMKVAREETFAPLAPVIRFENVEDVIAQANDTEFGLAAYVYSRDLSRTWRVAEALQCGMVGVNTGLISTEVAPFGGVRQSGFGREGSRYGVEDYLMVKYLCLGGIG